jgi:predicted house-cleaning noncanonical NTP pyrophosphatase (MazG superfamily)
MAKFRLNKLVRDNIVDYQLARGQRPTYHVLNREEHLKALALKIAEEAAELAEAPKEKLASEIADVEQALDDLKTLSNIAPADIKKAKAEKAKKNGAFKKGLFIETLEVPENDSWNDYYRSEPDRFPEVS